jgi:hypothetical protein
MPRINIELADVGSHCLTFDKADDPGERGVEVSDEFLARATRIMEEQVRLEWCDRRS